uniref:Uncharacterized protein n=1 Tax=Picea sitchensis TaxID=3332 RepID=B8LQD6_PICSI|nr:unknown [Picea sitchensis]
MRQNMSVSLENENWLQSAQVLDTFPCLQRKRYSGFKPIISQDKFYRF